MIVASNIDFTITTKNGLSLLQQVKQLFSKDFEIVDM
jgi:hypothetical protein